MRPLSAMEAITPAWEHARRLVIGPRSWGLALKVGAVAFLAQIGGCNGSYRNSAQHVTHLPPMIAVPVHAFALLLVLLAALVGLVLFYVSSRMQFVLLEVVLRGDTAIAPIWRRYGRATWYWMGLKVVYFLVALLCAAPVVIPFLVRFVHSLPEHSGGAPHDVFAFFMAVLGFVAAFFLLVLIISAGYLLLCSFGLPSMALESTPLDETVWRVLRLLRADAVQVLLYLVMYFVMNLAGMIAAGIMVAFCALVALIPLGGIGVVLWFGLHHGGVMRHVLMGAGWGVLGALFLAAVLMAAMVFQGYLYTFLQAYALYFLGGRYERVGVYLEPYVTPQAYRPSVAYGAPPVA